MAKRKNKKNEGQLELPGIGSLKRKGRNPKKEVSEGEKLLAKLLAKEGPGFDPSTVQARKPKKVTPPNIEKFIRKTNKEVGLLPEHLLYEGGMSPQKIAERAQEQAEANERRTRFAAERSAQRSQTAMESRLQRPESKAQQLLRGTSTPRPNVITTPDSLEGPPEPAKISQRQRRKLARDAAEQASGVKFTPGADTIGEDYRAKREEIIRGKVEGLAPLRKLGRRLDTASWVIPLAYLGFNYGKGLIRENFNVGEKFFDGVTAVDEFLQEEKKARMLREQERKRQMKLDMLRQENIKVLRGLAPGLAASLEAGMELPEDGIMIGGRPRADLLNLVADSMASGGPISMGV